MGISFPYNLSNGTTADADEVMANFNAVGNNFDQDTIDDASADNTEFQATKLPDTASKPISGREEIKTLRYQILQLMKLLKPAISTWDEVPDFLSAVLTTPQINDTSLDHQYIIAPSELTADRTITLPLLAGNMTLGDTVAVDNTVLKTKIIEIGDWDMDGAASGNAVHGLADETTIRSISVMIRKDDGDLFSGTETASGSGVKQLWIDNPISPTQINISRLGGGVFDNTDFNATSYNRGWVTITYVA